MTEATTNRTVMRAIGEKMTGWTGTQASELWPPLVLSVAFILLYIALDHLSFIEALDGFDITPWNPTAGITLALLIVGGVSYVPVVAVATLISGQLLQLAPLPMPAAVIAALVVGLGYAGVAALLREVLHFDPRLQRGRDLMMLIAAATIGAGCVAFGVVASYAVTGMVPWRDFREAYFQFWLGDAIGAAVFAPLALIGLDFLRHSRSILQRCSWLAALETLIQGASIAGVLALVFGFDHDRYSLQLFYLLFLPLVWIAARRGLPGASLAVVAIQAGLIAMLEFEDKSAASVRSFQLLMYALASTGLMLGAVVSERHRVARALEGSQGRLAAILNAARDGVLTIDGSGQIESVNPAVEHLFGRPAKRLIGANIDELFSGPNLIEQLAANLAAPLPRLFQIELEARHGDGFAFPVEVTSGHFGPAGDERHTLVIRDITLRREAESRIYRHQTEAAQLSRLSLADEMASALAHEINQPLTAITSFARGCLRLLRHPGSEAALLREGVEQIVFQAERAGDIISRVKEFMRAGVCHRQPVDVATLIEAAVGLVQIEAARNGIAIELRVASDLPSVLADHVQIEQVLLNLLRNAMDAILGGTVARRRIVVEARPAAGKTVEFRVTDTGSGLADEVADRLFEAFVTTKPQGMGLGLSISRSIVEAHEGHLRLHHSDPSGTSFAFDLPINEVSHADAG